MQPSTQPSTHTRHAPYWHLRTVRESLEVWIVDPTRAAFAACAQWLGRSVFLPVGTWLAQRLTRLALRIASEVVVAETEHARDAWALMYYEKVTPPPITDRTTLPLPVVSVTPPSPPPPVPPVHDVATLSAIAAALGLDPDPILPDSKVLPRALGNAITEAETQTIGWPDRLAQDLARAVLCWPRRVDDHLSQMLDAAGKLAPEHESQSESEASA